MTRPDLAREISNTSWPDPTWPAGFRNTSWPNPRAGSWLVELLQHRLGLVHSYVVLYVWLSEHKDSRGLMQLSSDCCCTNGTAANHANAARNREQSAKMLYEKTHAMTLLWYCYVSAMISEASKRRMLWYCYDTAMILLWYQRCRKYVCYDIWRDVCCDVAMILLWYQRRIIALVGNKYFRNNGAPWNQNRRSVIVLLYCSMSVFNPKK